MYVVRIRFKNKPKAKTIEKVFGPFESKNKAQTTVRRLWKEFELNRNFYDQGAELATSILQLHPPVNKPEKW